MSNQTEHSQEDITIILPVFNENVNKLHSLLENFDVSSPIIIIDDSTKYNLLGELHKNCSQSCKILAENRSITIVRGAGDEATSIHLGIYLAQTQYVILMDSDGTHTAKDAKELIHSFISLSKEVIFTSRYTVGGSSNTKFINKLVSSISNIVFKVAFPSELTDLSTGFLLAKKDDLLDLDIWYGKGDARILATYLLYKKYKKENKWAEIPVHYNIDTEKKGGITSGIYGLSLYILRCTLRSVNLLLTNYILMDARLIQQGIIKGYTPDKAYKVSVKAYAIETVIIIPLQILKYILKIIKYTPFSPFAEFYILNWSNTPLGYLLRILYFSNKIKKFGKNVLIGKNVNISFTENLILGNSVAIDSNVNIINSGILYLEDYVSIHQNTLINIKGVVAICKKGSCIGSNVAIYTATNKKPVGINSRHISYSYRSPHYLQEVKKGIFFLGKNSYIGTNSTVINSEIGDNVVIGANSFVKNKVLHNNETWAGSPIGFIKNA